MSNVATTTNAVPAVAATGTSLSAKVFGNIVIGTVTVPISTVLPPTTAGVFEFDYEAADPTKPTASGSVKEFFDWVNAQFSLNIPVTDLPQSLQVLSFGLTRLKFNTTFTVFDIIVLIGTETSGVFAAAWTPITSFPKFQLTDLSVEVFLPAS